MTESAHWLQPRPRAGDGEPGRGPTIEALRLLYFLLGLGLTPVAYFLGRALDPRAALPAALLLACPPPYFLLMAAIPAPLYPTTLRGVMLVRWSWSCAGESALWSQGRGPGTSLTLTSNLYL